MDIIKTIQKNKELWDLYTRKEEYTSSVRDQFDRFPYYASKNRDIFEPRVSQYLTEQGYCAEYPDGQPFAVCLSHDIDVLYKSVLTKGVESLRMLRDTSLAAGVHSFRQIHSKKRPYWNFADIMALEERYGAKSSFYFMVQHPGDLDYNYRIDDCETVIGELSDGGWEVGLHGGHTAYTDPVEIKSEKNQLEKVLNKNVVGYRNHYLRFRVPDTWEHLQAAGFNYDATFGYADCAGFRNGMCHPFKPYNLTAEHEIDILEIPLTIMDGSLDQYMKLDEHGSWEMTKRLIDTAAQYHGVFSVLWHNHNFIGEKRKFYENILKYCSEKGAWLTSGKEIERFFSGRM
jgi:hypothetical protein